MVISSTQISSHSPDALMNLGEWPRALFVNTHVLASACSYFRSCTPSPTFGGLPLTIPIVFDFSDGIVTSFGAGLPLGVEPTIDMEECDVDSDYDPPAQDPVERNPSEVQPSIDATTPVLSERAVKAYVVKYTAYRTFVGDS